MLLISLLLFVFRVVQTHGERCNLSADQKARTLIYPDDRTLRIVGLFIDAETVFHFGKELGIRPDPAPGLFKMRSETVFFRLSLALVCDRWSQSPSSTAWSASKPECPAASAVGWLRTSQSREFSLCLAGNLSRSAATVFVVKNFVQTALTNGYGRFGRDHFQRASGSRRLPGCFRCAASTVRWQAGRLLRTVSLCLKSVQAFVCRFPLK